MARSKIDVDAELASIGSMGVADLLALWRKRRACELPPALTRDLIARVLAWSIQVEALGEPARVRKILASVGSGFTPLPDRRVKPGSVIMREYDGTVHEVTVLPDGILWQGKSWPSLSSVAFEITGTKWNGLRFFGVGQPKQKGGRLNNAAPPATPTSRVSAIAIMSRRLWRRVRSIGRDL